MKTLALLCLLTLVFTGCVTSRKSEGQFASLHDRIAQMQASTCKVGPITRIENLGRFFEVRPHDSGYRILIFERQFFTQKDWDRKHACVTDRVAQFLTRTNQTKAETARGIAALEQMWMLPGWSYEGIGVDIDVQGPEVVYPESQRDQTEAQRVFDEIGRLLKPYRANHSMLRTVASRFAQCQKQPHQPSRCTELPPNTPATDRNASEGRRSVS